MDLKFSHLLSGFRILPDPVLVDLTALKAVRGCLSGQRWVPQGQDPLQGVGGSTQGIALSGQVRRARKQVYKACAK